MRKDWKKVLASVLGVTTAFTTLFQAGSLTGITAQAAEAKADKTVKLSPATASLFNDTDGDGFGEFQGFGTSLCWWANRVGYSDELTQQAATAFFDKEEGLGMTIGRYNVGGGDNVGEAPEVSVNDKAVFYDTSSENLSYAGSNMKVSTNSSLKDASFSKSDADFGFTSGKKVGSFDTIGWINNLDGGIGSGDNLHYLINANEDGTYTIKMLFTLSGTNKRGVSIKVTSEEAATYSHLEEDAGTEGNLEVVGDVIEGEEASDSASVEASVEEEKEVDADADDKEKVDDLEDSQEEKEEAEDGEVEAASVSADNEVEVDVNVEQISEDNLLETVSAEPKIYTVSASEVNKNLVASGNNNMLYVVTFENVELKSGVNKIDIGGADGDWCLDFVKMALIKSGEEGVLPESSDFLHGEHIKRSDSIVPGYATDVTKINLEKESAEYYETNFARADFECGYAWNYDWDADKNQMNVLIAAAQAAGDEFIGEAFSNSPPYFMTVSGCSSGGVDPSVDNLRSDSYTAFACYMADVIEHWADEGVINFQSTTPMNEPYTNYWSAFNNKQEGCHFDIGESQSRILVELNKELEKKGIDILISASDETSIDTAITSFNALTDEAKEVVDRIDAHTYSGSNRAGLKALSESAGKNLWMSEVDGTFEAGSNAGEMKAGLGFAQRIITDVNGMMPSAWIMWDAVDIHIDSNNEFDTATRESVENMLSNGDGFWGIAIADHDNQELLLSKKYYAFGQFSRYIRPGYAIIASSDSTVAAFDPKEGKVVVVAVNTAGSDQTWKFNLQDFSEIGDKVTAIRTSGSRADGENWADVTAIDNIVVDRASKNVSATLKANSITTYIIEGVTYDSSAETVVSVDESTIYAVKGTLPVLPKTVSVQTSKNNTINANVTWDLDGVDLSSAKEVTGNLDGYGYEVTFSIKYVEPNMAWYIDCNDNEVGHTSYKTMDSYADLFNEVPDQKYDGTWGRLADYGAYNNSDDDPWAYGWYAYSNQSIDYTVPLEAGDYTLTFGFKEWWNQSRPMSVYAVTDNGEALLGNTNAKNGNNNWNTPVYSYSLAEAGNVTFSVRKNGGPDPVLSFIRIQKNLKLDELKSALAKAQAVDTAQYSESKIDRLNSLLERAQKLMLRAATTQDDVDLLVKEISEFVDTDGNQFSEEEIAANDYVLYLVDVASKDTTVVPDGYSLGLYQTVTDQEVAVDAETGLKWGYETDEQYGVRVNGGSSDGSLTGTYAYMSDKGWTYEKGVSGLYYSFEMPDRSNNEYLVTIGVKSPWSARDISYDIEGTCVESGLNLGQNSLVERTYNVEVTDGTLNLYAYATNRTSSYVDPLLSYIIVKAVPEYDVNTLRAAIESYRSAMEGKTYTKETLLAFEEAEEAAKALIDANSTDTAAIKEAYKNLKEAFENLYETYIINYTSITGVEGAPLYDNNGVQVQAHGGQIQQFTIDGVTKYYWYGEDKTYDYQPVVGVHLYTSTDLYNWTDEGVPFKAIPIADENYGKFKEAGYQADLSIFEEDEYFATLYGDYKGQAADDSQYDNKLEEVYWNIAADRTVMERPKVLYNDKTGKYVMWWHCDGNTKSNPTGSNYGKARAGVAISDSPYGPFKFLGAYKLNYSETADHQWDSDESAWGSVRDMNVFKDDDGTAYVMYSSDGNTNMYIAKLNDEYTYLANDQKHAVLGEDFTLNFAGASREAPAMFKYNGTYYMITSGCTGWDPNPASYAYAESPMGPWTTVNNPCTDSGANTTYRTQSTCVFPVDAAAGKFIYMGDRWNSGDLSESRYVWLPVEFLAGNRIALRSYSNWTLDELENKGVFEINTGLPTYALSKEDLAYKLPSEIELTLSDGSVVTKAVTWNTDAADLVGDVEVTGVIADYNRSFTHTVSMIPDKMIYFYDSASRNVLGDEEADYLTAARKVLGRQIRNTAADEDFTVTGVSGYNGVRSSENAESYDVGYKNSGSDIWGHGFWAAGNKTIDYVFTLEKGQYTVAEGFQEWWNTSRPTRITVTDEAGNSLAQKNFTLGSSDSARLETVSFEVTEDTKVTVSVAKTGNPDPVLSFIAVIKDSMDKEKESLGYTNGRWYTKWEATYYETEDGKTLEGIQKVDGVYYCFNSKGAKQTSLFAEDGSNKYYFDKDGKMVTGWMTRWGAVYYFDENGVMQTGFVDADGATYYFSASGARQTSNWITENGNKYYVKSDGTVAKSEWINKWGSKYYFDEDGIMQTGFVDVDGKTYCLSDKGVLQTSAWIESGDYKYYAKSDGAMARNETITKWGQKYTFDELGHLVK
ncbi:Ig-like domain-containing protein [Butyrivibrio sp. VCB2006]|uniref:Ig-like domain-containing protein n=1 Tax=Butyrivibrio sp. VCB2006 TaxID=1280679 RepID=UPI0004267D0E|nr:Ig-like domain-containing protein [Butyrivibrio sp. VCB2006]